ncbi:MAG: dihydrofolate reductase family protein [Geminicoccaceae bacterium]|nr:dihydrofolate reductase family protein [Geminicoccaceae bacterium]
MNPRTTRFELLVVASADGFIGRRSGHNPSSWASPEEQHHFLASVDRADWSFMGRRTDEEAPREDRRRVIFSTSASGLDWCSPTRLRVDPRSTGIEAMIEAIGTRHPARNCLVLGGTRVHDWFLARALIDRVVLTIEPVRFGSGMPIVSNIGGEPDAVMRRLGFRRTDSRKLNAGGTRLETFEPAGSQRIDPDRSY